MGAEAVTHRAAVLLVPFPAQGHITPMLQLAGVLAAHGLAPTVAVPDFIHRRIAACGGGGGGVALTSIPSGIIQDAAAAAAGDDDADTTPGFRDIVHSMEHHMPLHLERMLTSPRRPPVACVVVDVLASWAVPVAARCGVPVAGFWPAMLACYRVVAAIPELLEKGLISESGERRELNMMLWMGSDPCLHPSIISGSICLPGCCRPTIILLAIFEVRLAGLSDSVLAQQDRITSRPKVDSSHRH